MTENPGVTALRALRQATIDRAIALIDANLTDNVASPALVSYLTPTYIRDSLKADPAALRRSLAAAHTDSGMRHFGKWKAAQQLLQAAGLPY